MTATLSVQVGDEAFGDVAPLQVQGLFGRIEEEIPELVAAAVLAGESAVITGARAASV